MTSFRTGLAWTGARMSKLMLHLLGRGATNFPGKVAMKIQPRMLSILCENENAIQITGTNGKTTTTHMAVDILREAGFYVVTNVSGANLEAGLITALMNGKKGLIAARKKSISTAVVLETDEAAFAKTAGKVKPKICVVTNLFRDQLDRYGELKHTRDCIAKGLDTCSAKVLLNSDDSLVAKLRDGREDRTVFFGLSAESMRYNNVTYPGKSADLPASSDAEYCTECKVKYEYASRSFGHLGDYSCPKCGDKRQKPRFYVTYDLKTSPSDVGFPLELHDGDATEAVKLSVPGMHNFYNSMAAVATTVILGEIIDDSSKLNFSACSKALMQTKAAFGRMEKLTVGDKKICVLLVKNPVGLDRALSFVSETSDADSLYMLLNSNVPDGKDVSWIWDVDFESKILPEKVFVSGDRYGDMLLRIVYSGIDEQHVCYGAMKDCEKLLDEALAACTPGKCVYVLPNYTSMLHLRKCMVKRYHLKDFWK